MNCFQGSIFQHSSTANTFREQFHTHKCIRASDHITFHSNTQTYTDTIGRGKEPWKRYGLRGKEGEGLVGVLALSIRLSALGVGSCACASMVSCLNVCSQVAENVIVPARI